MEAIVYTNLKLIMNWQLRTFAPIATSAHAIH